MSLSAEHAVLALNRSTHWPGLLKIEPGLEASLCQQRGVWHLSQSDCQVELEASSGRMLRGSWVVKPGQANLQLALATAMAGLGLYSLAYAAKLPCLVMAVNLAALLGGAFGAAVSGLLALLFLALVGAYLLDYCSKHLMSALEVVHSGRQQFPDHAPWREPFRLLAVAQGIYILDALAGAQERNEMTGPLLFSLAAQLLLILACSHLVTTSRDPLALPSGRTPLWDVLAWSGLWLVCLWLPVVAVFGGIPLAMLLMGRKMVGELCNGVNLNVHAETLTEKLFWLSLSLMLFVSFGALLGHTLSWATQALHPALQGHEIAKQCWVWGATLGTLLALFMAPLGPIKIPLFIASTLYQALLGHFGAVAALGGAVAVIFVQAIWCHPRQPRQALSSALTFGLAESFGRVAGSALGLFFLGLEGAAVGGALGERALGAVALLKSE
ncbi:hypothetical protein IV102_25290 [bacterium]|nr:hypothetical protein [bacterium]